MHKASLHDLSDDNAQLIRSQLVEWFSQNARKLPWRVPAVTYTESPYDAYVDRLYKCLVSETMLQQTQVKTVIDYYEKWLLRFPTIQALADANEEDVMACWAGLGYYSRAKRLQKAAQYLISAVVSKRCEFPRSVDFWVKHVPGVGPYTAGAILSISFDIPAAIVDGNVQRVLSRLLAVHGDTSTPKSPGSKLIWDRAAKLASGMRPGALNQSLMELGATICMPTQPSCQLCPVSKHCKAYQQLCNLAKSSQPKFWTKMTEISETTRSLDDVEDLCRICPADTDPSVVIDKVSTYIQGLYPFKPAKKKQREETAIVLIVENDDQALYLEKKAKGLLAGLYDFPTMLLESNDREACEIMIAKHKKQLGAIEAGTTVHLFSHIRRTSHVLKCHHTKAAKALASFAEDNSTGKWIAQDSLVGCGVSALCLKNWRVTGGLPKTKKRTIGKIPRSSSTKRTKNNSDNDACVNLESCINDEPKKSDRKDDQMVLMKEPSHKESGQATILDMLQRSMAPKA